MRYRKLFLFQEKVTKEDLILTLEAASNTKPTVIVRNLATLVVWLSILKSCVSYWILLNSYQFQVPIFFFFFYLHYCALDAGSLLSNILHKRLEELGWGKNALPTIFPGHIYFRSLGGLWLTLRKEWKGKNELASNFRSKPKEFKNMWH